MLTLVSQMFLIEDLIEDQCYKGKLFTCILDPNHFKLGLPFITLVIIFTYIQQPSTYCQIFTVTSVSNSLQKGNLLMHKTFVFHCKVQTKVILTIDNLINISNTFLLLLMNQKYPTRHKFRFIIYAPICRIRIRPVVVRTYPKSKNKVYTLVDSFLLVRGSLRLSQRMDETDEGWL